MIGFLIKKNFFDSWDNLFRLALVNIGFIVSISAPLFLPSLLADTPLLSIAVLILGILWCIVYLAAAAISISSVSDYGSFGFADFFRNLKEVWPIGLAMALILFVGIILVMVIIPFYLELPNIIGVLLAAVIFWTIVVSIFSLQYFFAIRARLDTKIIKIIKKCYIIFFDNPMFSIFCFFHTLFQLILSIFLAFIFPGPAGVLLFIDESLRLRLLKYDWLEENPEADRKKIPWDALLIDDRERTGTRSLRNFIFPWKD